MEKGISGGFEFCGRVAGDGPPSKGVQHATQKVAERRDCRARLLCCNVGEIFGARVCTSYTHMCVRDRDDD